MKKRLAVSDPVPAPAASQAPPLSVCRPISVAERGRLAKIRRGMSGRWIARAPGGASLAEIAGELGILQPHASRLLRASLARFLSAGGDLYGLEALRLIEPRKPRAE